MARKPEPARAPKPTVAERVERAKAVAAPKIEQVTANAGPKVEKAAQAAGSFLGTLRDRAKETAKQFADGYAEEAPGTQGGAAPTPPAPAAAEGNRPRPRPRPGPRAD